MVEIGPRWSIKIQKVFGTDNALVFSSSQSVKGGLSKNELNDLKRKRKIDNRKKSEKLARTQVVMSENTTRTLLINRAIRGE